MALISLQDVSIGFGGPRLMEEINLQIESEESIGLLGCNGMGKSTLLKLISGDIEPHEVPREASPLMSEGGEHREW